MMSETGHLNFKKRRRKFDIRPDKTNFGKAFKKLLCGCSTSRGRNEEPKKFKRFDDDIKFDDSKASPLFQNITRQFFEQELAKCLNKTSLKVFNNHKVDKKQSLLAISSSDTLETQCLSAATFFSTSFFQVSTPLQYQTYPISVNYYHNSQNTKDCGCQYEPEDNYDKTTSTKHTVADHSTQIDNPRLPPLLIQKIIKCLDLMSSNEPLDQTLQTTPVITCNKETNTGGNLQSTTVLFANHGNMVESSDDAASGMKFNFEVKPKKKKCLRYTSPVSDAKKHCCTSTSDTCMYTEVQAKFQEWLQFMQKSKKVTTTQGVQKPEHHQANSTQTRSVPTDLERKEAISKVAEFLTSENPLLTEDIQKSFNKLAAYREVRHKADLQNQKYPSFIVTEKCKLCEGKRKKLPKIIIEKKKKRAKEDIDPLSEKFIASLSDNGLQKVDQDIAEITTEIKQFLKTMVDDISDINLHGDNKYFNDLFESGSSKDDSLNSVLTTDLELQPFDEEFFTMFNTHSPTTIVPLLHQLSFLPTESNETTIEIPVAQKKSKKGLFSKKKPLLAEDSSATKSSVTTQSAICIEPEPSDWLDDVMAYDKKVAPSKFNDFDSLLIDEGNMAGTSSYNAEDLTHQGTMAGRSMFLINDKATNTGDEFNISKGIQASKGTSNKKLYVFKERKSIYDIGIQTLPAYGDDFGAMKIYPTDEKIMYARDKKKKQKVINYINKAKTLVRGILNKGRYCDSFTNTDFAEEEETEEVVIDEDESSDNIPQRDIRVKFSNFILECQPDGSQTKVTLPKKPPTTIFSRYKSTGVETTVLSIFSAVYNHKQALFSKNNKTKQNLCGFCKFGGGDSLDILTMPTNLLTYPVITNKICMNLSKSSDFDPVPKKKKPRRKLRRYRKPPRIKNPTGGKGTSSDDASKGKKKKKKKKLRKKRKKTQNEISFSGLLENPDQEQLARELAQLREREGQRSMAEISTQEPSTANIKEETKEKVEIVVSTPSSTKTEETPVQEEPQRPPSFKLLPSIFGRWKKNGKKGKRLKNSGDVVKMTTDANTTIEKVDQKKGDDKEGDKVKTGKNKKDKMKKDKKKEEKMKKDKKKEDKKKEDKMKKGKKKEDKIKKDKKKEDKKNKDQNITDKPDLSKEVNPESPADVHRLIITLMKIPEKRQEEASSTTCSLRKLSSTEVLEETDESKAETKDDVEQKGTETKEDVEQKDKREPKTKWWKLWKKSSEITATKKKSLEETTWLKMPVGGLESVTGTEIKEPNRKESGTEDAEDTKDTDKGDSDERKEPKEDEKPEQPPTDVTPTLIAEHDHNPFMVESLHARSFLPMRSLLPIVPELTAVDARKKIYNIHTFVGQSTTSNWPSHGFTRKNSFILVHEGRPSFDSTQISIDQRLAGSSTESSDDYLFRTEGDGQTYTRLRKALLKSGIRQHISDDSNILLYPTYEWRKFQTPSQLQLPTGVLSVELSSETESIGKFSYEEKIEEEEEPGAKSKSKIGLPPFDEEVEEFDEEGKPIHKEQLTHHRVMGERVPMNMLSEVRVDYHETGVLATEDLQNILGHLAEDHYDIMNMAASRKDEEFLKQIEASSEFSILLKTEEQRVNPFESSLANVGKPIEEIDPDLEDYLKAIGVYQPKSKAIGVYQREPKPIGAEQPEPRAIDAYQPEPKPIGAYQPEHKAIGVYLPEPTIPKPETTEASIQPDFVNFLADDHRNLKEGLGKIKDIDLVKNTSVKVHTGQAQMFIKKSEPFAHMKNVRVSYLGNTFLVTIPEEMISPTLEWCMTHKKVKEGIQALLDKNAIEAQGKLLAKLAKGKKSVFSGADDEDTLYTLQALVALAELNPRDAKRLSTFFAGICPNTKRDFMEVISRMKSEDAKTVFKAFGAMHHIDIRDTLGELFNIENKHAQTAYLLKIAKETLKRDVACECKIPVLLVPKKQKSVMAKVENQSKNVGTEAPPMIKKKDAGTDMSILKKEESLPKVKRKESTKKEVYPESEPIAKVERPDVRKKPTDEKPTEFKPIAKVERPDVRKKETDEKSTEFKPIPKVERPDVRKKPTDEKSTEFKPIAKVERPYVRNKPTAEKSKEEKRLIKVDWPDVKSCLFPGRKSSEDMPITRLERPDVGTKQTSEKSTEFKPIAKVEMPVVKRKHTGYKSTEEDPWGQQPHCKLKEDPQYENEDPEYKKEDPQYKNENPQNEKGELQRDGSKARREEWILKVLTPSEEGIQHPSRHQFAQSSVPPSPLHSRTPSRSSTPITLEVKSGEVQTDETPSWPTEAAISRVTKRLIPSFYKKDQSKKEFWSKLKEKRIPEKLGLIRKKDSCDKCCQIKETKPVDRNIRSTLGNRISLRRKDRRKLAEDIAMGLSEDAENESQQTISTPWNALKQSKTTQYVHHTISPYPINKGHRSLNFIDNLGSSTQSSSTGNVEIPSSSVTVTSETSYASLSDDLLNMIKKGNIMLDKEGLAGVLSRKYRLPSPIREMSIFPTMTKVSSSKLRGETTKKGMQIKLHGDTTMSCPQEKSNSYALGRSLLDDLLVKAEEELGNNQKKIERPQATVTLIPLKKASKSHSAISDGSKLATSPAVLSSSKSSHAVCVGLATDRKSPFHYMFKAATDIIDRVNRFHQPMLDPLVKSNIFAKKKHIAHAPSTESVNSKSSRSSRSSSRSSWSSSTRTDLSTKTIESSEYSCGICENHCQTEGLCYCRVSRSRNKSKHSRPVEAEGRSTRNFANHYQAEIKPYTCCAHSKKVTWHQSNEQPSKTLSVCSTNDGSSVTSVEKLKNKLHLGKRVDCPSRRSEYEEANSKLFVCKFKRRKKSKVSTKPSDETTSKDTTHHHGFFSKFFPKKKKEEHHDEHHDDHHDDHQPIVKPQPPKEPEKPKKKCSSCKAKPKSPPANSPATSDDSILKMAKVDLHEEKTIKEETTPKRKSWSIMGRKKTDPTKSQQPKARSLFMVRKHDKTKDEEPQPDLTIVKDSLCGCAPHINAPVEQKPKRCFIKRIPSSLPLHKKTKKIEEAPKVEEPPKTDTKSRHHFADMFHPHHREPCGCEPGHPEYPIPEKKSCCSKMSCASPKKTPVTSEESTTSVKDCTPGCRGFVERVVPPTPKSSRCSLRSRRSAKGSKASVKTAEDPTKKHSLNSILKKSHEKHDQKKKKKKSSSWNTVHHHHPFRHHKKVEVTDPSPSEEPVPEPKRKKTCSSCGKKKPDKASKGGSVKGSSKESLCTCEVSKLEKKQQKKKCSSCGKKKKKGIFGSTDSVCLCDSDTPSPKKKPMKTKKQNKKKCSTCGKKKKHGKLSSKSSLCKCDAEANASKKKGCSTCGKSKSCASSSKESLCHCDSLPRKVKPPPEKKQPQKKAKSCSNCGKKKPTTPMDSSTDYCKCGSETSVRSSTFDHKRHISMRHTPKSARSRPSSNSDLSEHGVEERLLCECTYSKFDVRHAEVPIVDIYSKVETPPTKEEVFQTLISMLMKRPRHKRYESTKRRKIKEYLSKVSSTELEDIVVEMVEQLPVEVRELIARMHKAQQTYLAKKKGNIKYNASNSYFKKFNQAKSFNQPNRRSSPQSEIAETSLDSSMEVPSSKYWKYDFYPNKENYSIDIDKVEVFCKARSSNCMEGSSFTTNYSVSLGGDEAEEAMEIIKLLSKLSPRNLCQFFSKQYT